MLTFPAEDPHGPHSEKHRRLIAVATARLQTREQRSRLVGEVLRALSILDRNTAKVDDLIERASTDWLAVRT